MRIKRRDHESCAGYGDEQIDVRGLKPGLRKTLFGNRLPELDGMLLIFAVGFRQRPGCDGVFQGKNSVTLADAGVANNAHHCFQTVPIDIENSTQLRFHIVTSDCVRRHCGGSCQDSDAGPVDVCQGSHALLPKIVIRGEF